MKDDLAEMIEAWRFNVELECSGASMCAIDEIAIGGAVLKLASLLPVLEFAASALPKEPIRGTECPTSPTGNHQVDTSMETGPNNCFHCEARMR